VKRRAGLLLAAYLVLNWLVAAAMFGVVLPYLWAVLERLR
jgi:hypothetical protein